jgi:hypothetical protein
VPVRNDAFSSAPQYNLKTATAHIDCDRDEDVNVFMRRPEQPAFPPAEDFRSSKSMIAALAGAGEFLKAGDLADAGK